MNAVDVVQEIVGELPRADPKKGCYETKGDDDGEVGGSKRQSRTYGRSCETGIRSGRQEVQHEVLGR